MSEAGGVTDFVRQYTIASGAILRLRVQEDGLRVSWDRGSTMKAEEQGKFIRRCIRGLLGREP